MCYWMAGPGPSSGRESFSLYQALSRGGEPDWQPAPPFRDYIAWLQQQAGKRLRGGGILAGVAQGFYDADTSWSGCRFRDQAGEGKDTTAELQTQLSRDETARLQAFARTASGDPEHSGASCMGLAP